MHYSDSHIDWSNLSPESIPNDLILNHPIVQDLTDSLEMKVNGGLPIPYIIPDRKLMSEGVWNDYFYPGEVIQAAYDATNWSDKTVVALYLNHSDLDTGAWIGEVRNPRMKGKDLYGDLAIYDLQMAIKLAFGKPRFGISPKVEGDADGKTMKNFNYQNFSLVVNPAVKTTYLNKDNKEYGGIYINQEDRIMTEKEVAVQLEETKSDAKVEAVDLKEEIKKEYPEPVIPAKKEEAPAVPAPNPNPEEKIKAKCSEYSEFLRSYISSHQGAELEEADQALRCGKKLEEMSGADMSKTLSEILGLLKQKQEPVQETMALKNTIQTMAEKITTLEAKAKEPSRLTVKAELSKSAGGTDDSFLGYLKGRCM
jgi:hypothetical protein